MIFFDWFKIVLISNVAYALASANWTQLLSTYAGSFLVERDFSAQIPVDQITSVGISLNELLFNQMGYTWLSLKVLQEILAQLVGVVSMNVYWNEFTGKWQICPAPIPTNTTIDSLNITEVSWNGRQYRCLVDMAPGEVFNVASNFLSKTNTEFQANIIQFALIPYNILRPIEAVSLRNSLKPASIDYNSTFAASGSYSLGEFMVLCLNYIYAPSFAKPAVSLSANNSTSYDSAYPTRNTFLFKQSFRMIVYVLSGISGAITLNNLNGVDDELIFVSGRNSFDPFVNRLDGKKLVDSLQKTMNQTYNSNYFLDMAHDTNFRLVYDSEDTPFTNNSLLLIAKSGFTPIVNSTSFLPTSTGNNESGVLYAMNQILPNSFWSWAPALLNGTNGTDINRKDNSQVDNSLWAIFSDTQKAMSCVTIQSDGWAVDNCYNQYRVACQNSTDPFSWTLSEKIKTYFATASSDDCPEGFEFNAPRLSLEQYSLQSLLRSTNVQYPVWIDVNDIYFPQCFVSGGPYAECPHQKVLTTTSLIKRIAPSLVVSLVVVILIVSAHLFTKSPIQSNRTRHWKKAIAEYYKENDFEGVPS